MLIDSHCHLNFPDLANRIDDIRANMAAADVTHALVISVNAPRYPEVLALAEQFDNRRVAVIRSYVNKKKITEDVLDIIKEISG